MYPWVIEEEEFAVKAILQLGKHLVWNNNLNLCICVFLLSIIFDASFFFGPYNLI